MRIQKYYKKQSYNKITGPQLDLYMYEYILYLCILTPCDGMKTV